MRILNKLMKYLSMHILSLFGYIFAFFLAKFLTFDYSKSYDDGLLFSDNFYNSLGLVSSIYCIFYTFLIFLLEALTLKLLKKEQLIKINLAKTIKSIYSIVFILGIVAVFALGVFVIAIKIDCFI